MADESKNLHIQQQINDVLKERAALLDANASRIQGQVQFAMELCKALDCEELEGMNDRLSEINSSLKEASGLAQEVASSQGQVTRETEKSEGAFKKVIKNLDAGTGAAIGLGAGLINGFKAGAEQARALNAVLGTMTSGIMGIGKAILMAPFSMLGGLIGMANDIAGAGNAIRQAYEDVREEFGSLASNEGKALVDGLGDLRSQSNDLAGTGLSLSKVFGIGPEGVAAAMKALQATASALGATFGLLSAEFATSAAEILMFQKGMGLSEDAMKGMAVTALASGKTLTDTLAETASMSLKMGAQFGISAKLISKDMGEMTSDFSNFGSMSQAEMAATSVYARKLGMDIGDMMGVIDKFDNFEDAAQGASMLAQSFGMNVDAMALMNAQSPAERIDILRDSFFEAGNSLDDMTRQERKLLEEQTGLTGAALEAAFANENMGTSYGDLESAGEDAADEQMSQEESLSKLADAIETMTETGPGFSSFFDAFAQGFAKGAVQAEGWMDAFANIRASMQVVYQFGIKLGKMFFELFPGMGELGEGIKKLFDPKVFKAFTDAILGDFKDFFKSLSTDPKAGFETFITAIGDKFKKFFGGGGSGSALGLITDGFKKIITAIGGIITQAIPFVAMKMVDLIKGLADKIRNPPDLGGDGFFSTLVGMFESMFKQLIQIAPQLLAAVVDLLAAVFVKHGGTIMKIGAAYLGIIFAKMMLVAALNSLKGAVIGKIASLFSKSTGEITQKVKAPKAPPGGEKGGFFDGLKKLLKKVSAISPADIIKAGLKFTLIAMMLLPPMAILALGMVLVTKIMMMVPFTALVKGFVGIAMALAVLAGMLYVALMIQPAVIGPALIGMLAGALLLVVGGVAFSLALLLISPLLAAIPVGTVVMGMIALAIAAAALIAMVVVGAALGASLPLMGLALIGMIAGAGLLVAGVFVFSTALQMIAPMMKGIAPVAGAIVLGMAAIAVSMLMMAIAAAAAIVGGVLAIPGALGAVLMVVFMGALMLLMPVYQEFGNAAKSIDWKTVAFAALKIAATMGSLALAAGFAILAGYAALPGAVGVVLTWIFMKAIMKLMPTFQAFSEAAGTVDWKLTSSAFFEMVPMLFNLALAGYLAAIAGVAGLLGALGMIGVGIFVWALVEHFLPGLPVLGAALDKAGDLGKMATNMLNLVIIFGVLAIMAVASLLLAIFANPLVMWVAKKGLAAIGEFAASAVDNLGPALVAIGAMQMGDPGLLKQKIDALAAVIQAVSSMGDVVIKIAMLDVLAGAAGGESGAILEGAAGFMDSMLGGATKLIQALAAIVSSMSEGDIKKLEAIGGVLSAIANLMTALQPPPGLMDLMADSGGGMFGGGDVDIKGIMGAYADAMGDIMDSMLATIVPMIEGLMAIDMGPDPEAAKMKAEAVGMAINAVVGMAQTFGDMASGVMDMNAEQQPLFGSGPSVKETMKSYMETMDMIMGAVKGYIPGIIGAIMVAAAMIGDPCVAKPKIEVVVMAMQALASFAEAIGSMQGQIPEPGWFDTPEEVLAQFMQTVQMIVAVAMAYIPAIVGAFLSISVPDPEAAKLKMEVVSLALAALADFSTTMESIQKAFGTTEVYATLAPLLMNLWMLSIGPLPLLMQGLTRMDVGNPEATAAKMEGLSNVMQKLNSFAGGWQQFANTMSTMADVGAVNIVENFGAIITSMAEIHTMLAEGLPTVDLVAELDRFGEGMAISSETISVENKPININVSFNVNMNANKIAAALSDTTITTEGNALATAGGT